ncbi:MAG: GYD domain-containing protein [Hyphomicrobiales bacterium]|uniref:GYD domain-containing protein n=1 Tax=Aestuariivirga sp. TaxID=2650926 RepID=UPI0035B1C8AD
MAHYILLANWTEQGIKNIKDSPARVEAARQAAKKLGCTMGDFYMTTGTVDMVWAFEAPDDETVAKFCLSLAMKGNIRTTTLKAFSEAEFGKIIHDV